MSKRAKLMVGTTGLMLNIGLTILFSLHGQESIAVAAYFFASWWVVNIVGELSS